jgi:hypothetical protein
MSTGNDIWEGPKLSSEDEALIDAYRTVGRPLDDLPYTDDFERLMDLLQRPRDRDHMHYVFRRLMNLRKRAVLPRTTAG